MSAVHVATVVAARGKRGEVAAICPSGHPERLVGAPTVLLQRGEGSAERLRVRRAWVHRGRLILHLEGIDDIDAAERLVGGRVLLEEGELPRLPPGHFYSYRLVGARVEDPAGRLLGHVRDTSAAPAHDLLMVETLDGRTVAVPLVDAIVTCVDVSGARVVVDAPEGLLEGEPEVAEAGR